MISYIIATYSGDNHKTNKGLSSKVLSIHMKSLIEFIKNNDKCLIKEIIIVCPFVKPYNVLEGYYRKELWEKHCPIPIKFVDYIGSNKHHSYDQWIQGMNCATSDYFLLIEDDYVIAPNTLYADHALLYLYKTLFPNNIGYLATKTSNEYHGFHASISNGVISRDTMLEFKDPLEEFYNINVSRYPQVNFSHLFIQNSINIKDFSENCRILFWNSLTDSIEDHSKENLDENAQDLIVPIQYVIKELLDKHGVI
jgi:hypothetical protein